MVCCLHLSIQFLCQFERRSFFWQTFNCLVNIKYIRFMQNHIESDSWSAILYMIVSNWTDSHTHCSDIPVGYLFDINTVTTVMPYLGELFCPGFEPGLNGTFAKLGPNLWPKLLIQLFTEVKDMDSYRSVSQVVFIYHFRSLPFEFTWPIYPTNAPNCYCSSIPLCLCVCVWVSACVCVCVWILFRNYHIQFNYTSIWQPIKLFKGT